ncbi:MAG: type II toxin-antitoxin system RelE/ParE family toxin [Cyanobacteria bacterium P01_D01_bin.36]
MSYSLVIRPEAEFDIQDAYKYYESKETGLGSEFVRAVDACLSKVGRNPESYPVVHKQIRRSLLRRFPYGIFYIIENTTIVVIACFHAKRSPKNWAGRNS